MRPAALGTGGAGTASGVLQSVARRPAELISETPIPEPLRARIAAQASSAAESLANRSGRRKKGGRPRKAGKATKVMTPARAAPAVAATPTPAGAAAMRAPGSSPSAPTASSLAAGIPPPPQDEAEAMTLFGARRMEAERGKPRYLGVILTLILVALIGLAALWSSLVLSRNDSEPKPVETAAVATPRAPAPTIVEPALLPDLAPPPETPLQGAPAPTGGAGAAAPDSPAADTFAPAPTASDAAASATVPPETTAATAETDAAAADNSAAAPPLSPPAEETGDATVVATARPAPAPDGAMPPGAEPTSPATAAPASPAAAPLALPAAPGAPAAAAPQVQPPTDGGVPNLPSDPVTRLVPADIIVQQAPEAPKNPVAGTLGQVLLGAVDTNQPDAAIGTLTAAAQESGDAAFEAPIDPPAFGTVFDLNAQGLVKPTPDGAVTPQGVVVYAGVPPAVPPLRPGEEPPATQPAAAQPPPPPLPPPPLPPPPLPPYHRRHLTRPRPARHPVPLPAQRLPTQRPVHLPTWRPRRRPNPTRHLPGSGLNCAPPASCR